jgi:hypothetical protein
MIRWLILATCLIASSPALAQSPQFDCVALDAETKDKVRAIMLQALDQALQEQIVRMYTVWMRASEGPARLRAREGTRQGIIAYSKVRDSILHQDWDCK